MRWVNNSGMSLWEALLPLGLVLGLMILAAVGTGLALGEIARRRTKPVRYCDFYDIAPTDDDDYAPVWPCCGGPYDERPGGHYADCPTKLT